MIGSGEPVAGTAVSAMGRRAAAGLAIAASAALLGCSSTVSGPPAAGHDSATATSPPTPPSAAPAPVGVAALPGLLLDLDDMRRVINAPTLLLVQTWRHPDTGFGVTFQQPDCLGATASGMAATYDGSGHQGVFFLAYDDPASQTDLEAGQGVAAFPTPAAAQAFLAQQDAQWHKCAGTQFTETPDGQPPITLSLGQVTENAGMITLGSTSPTGNCMRAMAVKDNIVVDNGACEVNLADQVTALTNAILAKIMP